MLWCSVVSVAVKRDSASVQACTYVLNIDKALLLFYSKNSSKRYFSVPKRVRGSSHPKLDIRNFGLFLA